MTNEYRLPQSWKWTTLDECSLRITDGTHQPPPFVTHGVPFIFVKHIVRGTIDFNETRFISDETYRRLTARCPIEPGDILYSAVGSYGVAVPVDTTRAFSFQRHIAHIKPSRQLSHQYLVHWLNSPRAQEQAHRYARGVAQKTVTLGDLNRFTAPIAPVAEQRRIVAAIEEQFTRLDAAIASLQRARANLKRYRASVFVAAIDGRLVRTEAELARRERRGYETGEQLLARLGVRASGLAAGSSAGDLPEGWTWTKLAAIAELRGGLTKGQRRAVSDVLRLVPYLRVANVQRGYLDLAEVKTIDATEQEITYLQLREGDVLFNEGGDRDKLGRGWVWRGELPECIHQNHVFRARLRSSDLQPKYLSWYGNSAAQRYFVEQGKQTTNLASINLTKLGALPVPVPPANEQRRLVTELEHRLSAIEEMEASVEANLKRAARLRQAILKRAFEGKLVPQDLTDEPASVLLERIRAERTITNGTAHLRRPYTRVEPTIRAVQEPLPL